MPALPDPVGRARPAGRRLAASCVRAGVGAALLATGCVGPGEDLHASPVYSDLSTAGGGREV